MKQYFHLCSFTVMNKASQSGNSETASSPSDSSAGYGASTTTNIPTTSSIPLEQRDLSRSGPRVLLALREGPAFPSVPACWFSEQKHVSSCPGLNQTLDTSPSGSHSSQFPPTSPPFHPIKWRSRRHCMFTSQLGLSQTQAVDASMTLSTEVRSQSRRGTAQPRPGASRTGLQDALTLRSAPSAEAIVIPCPIRVRPAVTAMGRGFRSRNRGCQLRARACYRRHP
ncbi:hypothetical protein GE09DRAFT_578584 [Coniochaeta sp. 2T2.1]|nr:hypothetical protein GE09DRAFT_578584 [Coniochaeta sp. 2T2.1]